MNAFFGWMLESSLFIIMILGIRKLFMGKIRYSGICALWVVVFLRFLIPINLISTPWSVGNVVTNLVSIWNPSDDGEMTADNTNASKELQQEGQMAGAVNIQLVKMITGKQPTADTEDTQADGSASVQGSGGALHTCMAWIRAVNWTAIAKYSLPLISALLFIWLVLSNVLLMRRLKQGRVLYGYRETVPIYATDEISNPCLYGFFHPVIYLPAALVSKDNEGKREQEELEQIITHEYVHYRHRDYLWAMLRMLLVSVYWFDPFLWLAVSCSKKDAELYCDETVIRLLGEEKRFSYGEMLVRFAGDANWKDFRYSMMAISRNGKEMEKRIRAISANRRYSGWRWLPLAAAVFMAAALTCSTGISLSARAEKKTEVSRTETQSGKAAEQNERGEGTDSDKSSEAFQEDARLSMYSDFLRKHVGDDAFRYYSLASLTDGQGREQAVLLVSAQTEGIDETTWGSNDCRIYNMVKGKVTLCGKVVCGSREWLRLSEGKILSASLTSAMDNGTMTADRTIKKTGITADANALKTDTAEEEEFEQMPCLSFYTNPYVDGQREREPEKLTLQNTPSTYRSDVIVSMVYSPTYPEAFAHYTERFTEAVNTGNTDNMYLVLDMDSEVYGQQCALVKNYYKRGIREEIQSCTIASAKVISPIMVEIDSKESIRVYYADGTSKLVKQKYRYTCEYSRNGWLITKMEEIQTK